MLDFPPCPHRKYVDPPICLIASKLALLYAAPTVDQCIACTNHFTLPQKINGIVCAIAKKTQVDAGLEPDEKLTRCIHTEQTLAPDVLEFLRNKWKLLHNFKLAIWNAEFARKEFNKWKEDIPTFGCASCSTHFDEFLKKFPPNFSSQEEYFVWTVFIHNEVNKAIFKDEFPLEKARELYG